MNTIRAALTILAVIIVGAVATASTDRATLEPSSSAPTTTVHPHDDEDGALFAAAQRAEAEQAEAVVAWVEGVERAEAEAREAARIAAWVEGVERAEAEARARAEAEAREAARIAAWVDGVRRAEAEARRAAQRAAAPAANSGGHSGHGGTSGSGWDALRRCESGGNYGAVSGTGKYRGAYQFSRSTWDSVARSNYPHLVGVDPAAASPADQDAMAAALYASSGSRPWPHCGRHL